jgi:hypothetical protein
LFEAIDKRVRIIRTFAGDKPDATFIRLGRGQWQTRLPTGETNVS